MAAASKDQAYSNLVVANTTTTNRIVASTSNFGNTTSDQSNIGLANINLAYIEEAEIGNLTNDSLNLSTINNGLQFHNIQQQVTLSNHQNFILNNTIAQLTAGNPLPMFGAGRTVTFNNNTSSTTLDIYVTEGYPSASGPTIIPGGSSVASGAPGVVWSIPTTAGWSGNFTFYPSGLSPVVGGTLAEFGFNQLWSGAVPPLRDTFDISTVPPGIGTQCNDGPHSACSAISLTSGFSSQQSKGFNVGVEIIPPAGSLPAQTVICTQVNGNSPNSIGYPNDTAFPKQQTIELTGNYIVNLLDPVVTIP